MFGGISRKWIYVAALLQHSRAYRLWRLIQQDIEIAIFYSIELCRLKELADFCSINAAEYVAA
jgi:hypothetical protein